jgi:hypothetical protein
MSLAHTDEGRDTPTKNLAITSQQMCGYRDLLPSPAYTLSYVDDVDRQVRLSRPRCDISGLVDARLRRKVYRRLGPTLPPRVKSTHSKGKSAVQSDAHQSRDSKDDTEHQELRLRGKLG